MSKTDFVIKPEKGEASNNASEWPLLLKVSFAASKSLECA